MRRVCCAETARLWHGHALAFSSACPAINMDAGKDTGLCRARHKHVHAVVRIMPSRSALSLQDAPIVVNQRGIIRG